MGCRRWLEIMKAAAISRIVSGLCLICVVVLGLWAFWLEPASLHNENHEISLPSWPAACDRIRVAVLADLHVGSPFNGIDKLERIVDLTLAAKPDLILLVGDYVIHKVVGGKFIQPEIVVRVLGRLAAPLGVFAVLGNHDRWHNTREIENAFETVGIPVLEDTAVAVISGQCRFSLVGLSDFWTGPREYGAVFAKLPRGAPALAFTHNPDVFPIIPRSVNLTFAGHTHGGQVYFPVLGRLIVPSRYGQRYASGHIVEEGRHLFVSPGLGTSILPVRFLVPPEVSVVTIRSADSRRGERS
jgi:predicted MPP superfamily phosphohydrolase